ncbi:chaperone modulatory protein CbpM [Aliidiomarina minuta]|uniref:Chaperone modulatory protein CbpM n=1 Tax=Aliidiomarina minuta TaxID=880057 RepID=A0A432W6D1_9GAMM|nr:chaperone modulator CbpM [Aliidiomarina minuta]RUO25539.1 chaperone modulatory protein CbpM [Aliidiomarina minuta]
MTSSRVLYVGFEELCQCASIDEQQMLELIEQEIITPAQGEHKQEWQFTVTSISIANKAARMHGELVTDWADMPLVLSLLDELEELRKENERLQQRLQRFCL